MYFHSFCIPIISFAVHVQVFPMAKTGYDFRKLTTGMAENIDQYKSLIQSLSNIECDK